MGSSNPDPLLGRFKAENAENILKQMGIAELAECHPLALSGGQ